MKKKILFTLLILLSLFTFTGCGSNKRSFHNLLNQYVEAYAHIKIDALKDVYPPFYVEYAKDSLTEKNLEKNVEQLKKLYGDDFKLSYKIIDSVKLTDEELEELNSKMTKKYGAKEVIALVIAKD